MNRYRLWGAGVFAALALGLVAVAGLVPFMDDPPAGVAGSVAALVIAAEIAAAIALLLIGRELYLKLWKRLQEMRAELSDSSAAPRKGDDHE